MDANQWTQIVGSLKGVGDDSDEMASSKPMVQERKVRPQKEQALNCPRCQSTNTKFCYYNNYSLTQPRYFCKTCRRYWTEGGTLRNVPVGGGSRKNKRSSSSTTNNITSSHNMKLPHHVDLNPPDPNIISHFAASQNPKIHIDGGQDLNLAFPPPPQDHCHHHHHILNGAASQFFDLPKSSIISSSSSSTSTTPFAALELLASRSRMPELNALCSSSSSTSSSGLSLLQDLKPAGGMISLSLDHHHGVGSRTFNIHPSGIQENNGYGGRLMFPFGVMKQIQSTNEVADQNKGQSNPNGYWNGMFGGGGSAW